MNNNTNYNVLYIGGLFKGCTGHERLLELRNLGFNVINFDTARHKKDLSRFSKSLHYRLAYGPVIRQINADLIKFIDMINYDIVWISKGIWIYPQTIEKLKKESNIPIIHFTPDAAIIVNKTRHFIKSIPIYDALITSKYWEIDLYKEYGAKEVIHLPQGVNLDLFKPYQLTAEERTKYYSDICFIGRCEPHYRRILKCIDWLGIDLAVWGPWPQKSIFNSWLNKYVRGHGVWHINYAKALCGAKIGLGLLSKLMPETATTRTFEIPACGTFMLAERTEEHLSYFEEGKEAEFFDSEEELLDKIKYYLNHERERESIARAGRERCLRSDYSNKRLIQKSFEIIESLK